jgi:transposase
MGRRSHYPEEFRREAVRLVLTTDKSAAQVARDLGISDKTLGNWVRVEQEKARPGALSEDERLELKRLRKENSELKTEREIL